MVPSHITKMMELMPFIVGVMQIGENWAGIETRAAVFRFVMLAFFQRALALQRAIVGERGGFSEAVSVAETSGAFETFVGGSADSAAGAGFGRMTPPMKLLEIIAVFFTSLFAV
jgi:hypothetical protein